MLWSRSGRDVLHGDAVRRDVMDLAGRGHVNQIVGLNFDLISWRKKRVEPHNEIGVTLEELGHPADHARGVDTVE